MALPTWLLSALDLDEKEGADSPLRYPPTNSYSSRINSSPRGGESQLLDPVTGRPHPSFRGGEPGLAYTPLTERYRRSKQRELPSSSDSSSVSQTRLQESVAAFKARKERELISPFRFKQGTDTLSPVWSGSGPAYDRVARGWITEEEAHNRLSSGPINRDSALLFRDGTDENPLNPSFSGGLLTISRDGETLPGVGYSEDIRQLVSDGDTNEVTERKLSSALPTWLLSALDLDEKEGKDSPLRYPPTERYSTRTSSTPKGGESQLLDPVTGRPRPAFQGGDPGLVPPPFTERYRRTKQRRAPSLTGTPSDTPIPEHVLSEDLLAGPVIDILDDYDRYLSEPKGRPWMQGQSGPSYDTKNHGWISEEDTRKRLGLEPVWSTPEESLFTMTGAHLSPAGDRVPLPSFRGGIPAYQMTPYEDIGDKDLSEQFANDLVEGKKGFAKGGKTYVVETASGELVSEDSEPPNIRRLVGRSGARQSASKPPSSLPSWLQSAIEIEDPDTADEETDSTLTPADRARRAAELQSRLAIPGGLPGTTSDPGSSPNALLGDQGLAASTWKGTFDPIADASQRGFHSVMKSGFGAAEFFAQTPDPKLKETIEGVQRWAGDSADAEQRIIEAATDPNRPEFRERFSADPAGTIVQGAAEALPTLAGYVGLGTVAPAALPAAMFAQGAGATYSSTRAEGADPIASTLAAATSGAVNAALGAVQIERIFSGLGPAGATVVDRLKHLMVTGLIGAGTMEVQTVADSAVYAAATAEEDGRLAAARDAVVAGADVDSVLEIMVPGFVASVMAAGAVGGRGQEGEAPAPVPAEDGGLPLPLPEIAATATEATPVGVSESLPPPPVTPRWLAEQGGRITEQSKFINEQGNPVDRKMIDFRPTPEERRSQVERRKEAREFERRVTQEEAPGPTPEWLAKYGEFEELNFGKRPSSPTLSPEITTDGSIEGGIAGSPGNRSSSLSLDRKLANPESVISPREIVDHLSSVSGVPIRKGRGYFGQRKTSGWYDPRADEIRTKEALDLTTSYHEFGHAIHDRVLDWDIQQTAPAEVKSELIGLGRELYGDRKPAAGYAREGIAEYLSQVIHGNDPATFAPHTQAWMDLALASRPEIREGISRARDLQARWDQQGAFARVASQIDKTPLTLSARVKEIPTRVGEFVSNFRKNWINDADLAEKAETRVIRSAGLKPEDVKPSQRPISVVRFGLNMSAPGTARRFLEQGAISGHDWSRTGISLREALAEIPRGDIEDWKVYAYARRAQERYFPQGQNPGISEADASFVVDQWKNRPGFESGVQKFTEVSNLLMDYFQASGGISDEARAIYEAANPIYLPLRRAFEEQGGAGRGRGKGEYSGSRPVRRVRGGGEAILDPLEAFARQAEATITLANKLQVRRSIAELAEAFPGNGWFATRVEPPKTTTQFKLGEIEADLAKMGLDTSHLSAADKENLLSVFKVANEAPGNENIVDIWRNGEREFWQFDPDVYRAVTEMDRESLPGALMTFATAARLVRVGATGLKGSFSLVTNPLMDSQAWNIFTQKKGFTSPLSAHRGTWLRIKSTLDKSVNPHIDRFMNQGGEMTSLMGLDRREAARAVDEALGSQSFRQRFSRSPLQAIDASHPVDAMRKVFGFFELSPRITEYEAVYNDALARWGDPREAALAAKAAATDVTLPFTRGGVYARVLNRMYPFFNANLQGTDKLFRSLSGGMGKKVAAKTVAKAVEWLTLPTILLWAVNKDEKWYQEIPQEERLRYWHFNLTDDPANRVRLRKPPLLGEIFAGIPEAALERLYRDPASPYTESEVDEAVWAATKSVIPMTNPLDLAPALIRPTIEVATNTRSFPAGEPIDQPWEETSRLPEDRFNTNTTETAKAIGQLFHISPKRVEVWLSDQTGGLGLELARNAEFIAGLRTMKKTGLGSLPIVGTAFPGSSYNWPKSVKLLGSRLEYLRQVKGSDKLTPELERELEVLGGAEGDIKSVRQDIRDGVISETEGHEQITDLAREAWANRKK